MAYPVTSILVGAIAAYMAATLIAGVLAPRGLHAQSADRIGCIDGLRGYLAVSVLIHHFIIWMQVTRLSGGWEHPTIVLFDQLGGGAVALFFMTTGFVFYPRVVLKGFRASPWPAIYVTRVFRIVPLVAFAVAVITAIAAMRTGNGLDAAYPKAALKWITTWSTPPLLGYEDTARINAYVLWSLWYEWLFYLFVLPLCALAVDLIRSRLPTWVVPASLFLVAVALRGPLVNSYSIVRYLPLFAIGMLAFECQSRETLARALRSKAAAIAATIGLLAAVVAFRTPYGFSMPLLGFFFACVACGNSLGGILKSKGALVLGDCSYGIYLLHGILLSLLFVDGNEFASHFADWQLPVLLPALGLMVTLIAALTYRTIERPAIRLGARIARQWTGRRVRTNDPEVEVAP